MIKSQLTLNVASQFFHLPHRVVEKAVNIVLDEIVTALVRKDRVELRGFGAFSVKDRAGRVGRNPRSGAKIEVAKKGANVQVEQRNAQTAQPRCFDTRIVRTDFSA